MRHPFDSDAGVARLRAWLEDRDEEHFSYAVSAVAALPFLNHTARAKLLEIGFAHSSPQVSMEAAWAAGKLGMESGIAALAAACLDLNRSSRARRYLLELQREDAIPAAANSPDFAAQAAFAEWLAHPSELGRPPDEIDIYDHRTLRWPPEFADCPVWLIRYRVKDTTDLVPDDVGVGMVGTVTFCFFSYELHQRPPEDGYAIHCCWELERAELLEIVNVEAGNTEYDGLRAQWMGAQIEVGNLCHVAEVSPELKYPRRLVAVAEARRTGAPGWAVFDGADSRWYPADEMPAEESAQTVLKVHIGRQLLGFTPATDRKNWLRPAGAIPAEQIAVAYERLLDGLPGADEKEQERLLLRDSPLGTHFDAYVDALVSLRGGARMHHFAKTYERLLNFVDSCPAVPSAKAFDTFAPLGMHFAGYARALAELGRVADASPLIHRLIPLWEHNRGYGTLGTAAFAAGDDPLAESLLLKLKHGDRNWSRSEEVTLLAEIMLRRGADAEAKTLLIECLRATMTEAKEATGSDVEFFEKRFQHQRRGMIRLFPDAAAEMTRLGIPDSTLRG